MEADELFISGKTEYSKGKLDEAADCFEKSLALNPISAQSQNNLLLTLNYSAGYSPEKLFAIHRDFDVRYGKPLAQLIKAHPNSANANRRLRIGYVSPDFKDHPVAYFMAPVLTHHNQEQFEVFCYYNFPKSDDVTKSLRAHCHHWRETARMSDEQVANLIRRDEIDILIDLAGHSGFNRLLVFVQKPAPVQVTWLGYPNTTGLSAIDYRITDAWTDPVGSTEQYYTERLIRLPKSFLCYSPPPKCPEISPLPAIRNGVITFASLNNFAKTNHDVIALWIKLLKEVPLSRLLLTYNGGGKLWLDKVINQARSSAEIPIADLRGMSNLQFAQKAFSTSGIAANRIKFTGQSPSHFIHLQHYQHIDIALDPFPYNGTTTTCESLWMGVPVITLKGNTHASRVSSSILNNLGLAELCGSCQEDYLAAAQKLSANTGKLAFLRTTLRSILGRSSLMNGQEFTANLESAYRHIWAQWCKKNNT